MAIKRSESSRKVSNDAVNVAAKAVEECNTTENSFAEVTPKKRKSVICRPILDESVNDDFEIENEEEDIKDLVKKLNPSYDLDYDDDSDEIDDDLDYDDDSDEIDDDIDCDDDSDEIDDDLDYDDDSDEIDDDIDCDDDLDEIDDDLDYDEDSPDEEDNEDFLDDEESPDEEDLEDQDEVEDNEVLLKSTKKKEKKLNRSEFDKDDVKTISGFPCVPLRIDSYESIPITDNEAKIVREVGITSFVLVEGEFVRVKVIGTNNCLAKLGKDNYGYILCWISDFVTITAKKKASNGSVYVDIVVADELNTKKVTIPISILTDSTKVKSLSKYDISVHAKLNLTVAIALKKVLETIPITDKEGDLGVIADKDSKIGISFNAYSIADGFEEKTDCVDYEDYIENLNELLSKSIPLQFLISATMAAPILTILQEVFNYDLHSYCINIVGSSSTGKTICTQAAASMWTNPNSDKIFSAMLSTTNAALRRLSGRNGIPTFLDEASAVIGNIKAEEYAYQVYEQCEKHRLNSDCSEKASGKWSTIVTMTSEQRFAASNKNQNGGLAVRIHVINDKVWTADRHHAEELASFVRNNYGLVGKKFVTLIFSDVMFDNLEEHYAKARKAITKFCEGYRNDFTDRLCQSYALTLMTAQILKNHLGLEIDVKGVAKILAEHNKFVASEQNLGLNAFKAIVSYVARNPEKSGIRKVIEDMRVTRLIIEDSLMCEILAKAGFQDAGIAIKKLDEANFLIRQGKGKGLKSKLKIDDNLCYCYQIDLTSMHN